MINAGPWKKNFRNFRTNKMDAAVRQILILIYCSARKQRNYRNFHNPLGIHFDFAGKLRPDSDSLACLWIWTWTRAHAWKSQSSLERRSSDTASPPPPRILYTIRAITCFPDCRPFRCREYPPRLAHFHFNAFFVWRHSNQTICSVEGTPIEIQIFPSTVTIV